MYKNHSLRENTEKNGKPMISGKNNLLKTDTELIQPISLNPIEISPQTGREYAWISLNNNNK